jgi:hypothetical protein
MKVFHYFCGILRGGEWDGRKGFGVNGEVE